jgi:hypothetical protein
MTLMSLETWLATQQQHEDEMEEEKELAPRPLYYTSFQTITDEHDKSILTAVSKRNENERCHSNEANIIHQEAEAVAQHDQHSQHHHSPSEDENFSAVHAEFKELLQAQVFTADFSSLLDVSSRFFTQHQLREDAREKKEVALEDEIAVLKNWIMTVQNEHFAYVNRTNKSMEATGSTTEQQEQKYNLLMKKGGGRKGEKERKQHHHESSMIELSSYHDSSKAPRSLIQQENPSVSASASRRRAAKGKEGEVKTFSGMIKRALLSCQMPYVDDSIDDVKGRGRSGRCHFGDCGGEEEGEGKQRRRQRRHSERKKSSVTTTSPTTHLF